MTELQKLLEEKGKQIVEDLIKSAIEKDYNVTGNTIASFRSEATNNRLAVYGASYLNSLEFGRPPLSGGAEESDFLAKLEVWMRIRGITGNPKSLRYMINKFGTRLYQGKDPRFNGKDSKLVSDVINDESISKLIKDIEKAYSESIVSEIKKIFPQ